MLYVLIIPDMRKLLDTCVLIFLLIGPAVILTCVRQPTEEVDITKTEQAEAVPIAQVEGEYLLTDWY